MIFEFSPNFNSTTDTFTAFFLGTIYGGVRGDVGYNTKTFASPSLNAWHNLVFVYDKSNPGASEIQYYLDGALQTLNSQPTNSDNTNNFGNRQLYLMMRGGSSQPTAGIIDDVRIYNRALTAGDVAELYNKYAVPRDGLVAWWQFDEGSGTTVRDPVGGNTGTLVNGPTFVPGKSGKALSFNGSSTYVNVGASNRWSFSNAATLSVWVKTTSPNYGRIIVLQRASQSSGFSIGYGENATGTAVNDGIPVGRYRNGGAAYVKGITAINDGRWHNIIFVINNTLGTLYVDSASVATVHDVNTTNTFAFSSDFASIGTINGMDGFFSGSIDDTRIYNRALSAAEVAALYRAGSGPTVRGFNKIKVAARIKF